MPADTIPNSTLQVGQVLKSTWLVIRKNFILLVILATIIHPISWKLVRESSEFFKGYFSYILSKEAHIQLVQLEESIKETISSSIKRMNSEASIPENFTIFDFLAQGLFFILLQVVFIQLTFDTLRNPQLSMSQRHIFEHFQRTEFFFDVLRSIGIIVVSYVALFVFPVVGFGILAMAVFSGSDAFIVLVLCVMIVLMIFSAIRISVAIPMTVIENSSVMKSLSGSWRITAPCWKKFLGILIILFYSVCVTYQISWVTYHI